MPCRIALCACLAAASVALAAPARARGDASREAATEAQAHLKRGLDLYAAGDYEAAIEEFRAGYALDPRAEFLFAWAQAARLSGDCRSALELYRKFLETEPPARQVGAVGEAMAFCEAELESRPGGLPAVDAEPPPQPPLAGLELSGAYAGPLVGREPARRGERSFWRDPVSATLFAGGIAAAGAGGAFYLASLADEEAAADATSYEVYAREIDEAESRRLYAVIGLAAGTGLLATAAVRWLWARPGRRSPAVTVTASGASLWVQGTF